MPLGSTSRTQGTLLTPAAAVSLAFESRPEAYSIRGSVMSATSFSGSALIPTTTSFSEYFFCSAFNSDMYCREGALQVAQKLRSTNLPSRAGLSPSHLSTCKVGPGLPSSDLSEIG